MRGPRHFDPDMLHAALRGLENERDKFDAIIRDIRAQLGRRARPSVPKQTHNLSAAGRRRIVEAQKKRWAEYHKTGRKGAMQARAAAGGSK